MNDWHDYVPPADLLKGRVILITGTTSGIGRAVALAAARHGATVLLHGRKQRELEALHDEVAQIGAEPAVALLDFERAQGNEYQHLTTEIENRYGRLDGLLHNAALLGDRSPIEHYDIGTWQRVMHVNVNAAFILTRCLLPLMRESADASLLFTTSGVGRQGRAYWGAYSVSKFAIEGMTQILADELERTKIRVNCINPGATRTKMRSHAYPAEDPQTVPPPENVTSTYLYLLGPDSKHVNGQRIDCRA
ncbi:MAG: YciK family oxidoreductase [Gammaproteobacteria bacterium]|nr:YciK family oxidoreductase [Gammaproteobacteria bacterium]